MDSQSNAGNADGNRGHHRPHQYRSYRERGRINHGRLIASGTSTELKAMVGGDRLELTVVAGEDPRALAAALTGLGSAPASVDAAMNQVTLPVANGPAILPEVANRLAALALTVADLAVRRPSLDDVFLSLTGRSTSDTSGR